MVSPITVADAQTHLRLGPLDLDESAELERIIEAATDHASAYCNQQFTDGSVTEYHDSFPSHPGQPVNINIKASTTPAVTYYDTSNNQQTATGVRHIVRGGRTSIYPEFGGEWPQDCNNEPGSVTVTGSPDTSAVPAPVKSAILLYVGDLYENRENSVVGTITSSIQLTAERLLTPYKTRAA